VSLTINRYKTNGNVLYYSRYYLNSYAWFHNLRFYVHIHISLSLRGIHVIIGNICQGKGKSYTLFDQISLTLGRLSTLLDYEGECVRHLLEQKSIIIPSQNNIGKSYTIKN